MIHTYENEKEKDRNGDFKELAHVIMGSGKPEIYKGGQQPGYSGKGRCCSLEYES